MLRRARQGKARVGEAEMNANFARRIRSVTAYSERTGDDEERKVGPETAGQGSGEEIGVRRLHDPDPRPFAGLDRHRRGGVCPVRAPFVCGADRSRRGAWGVALAIVLSFPVRALSHFMPRGLAILLTV